MRIRAVIGHPDAILFERVRESPRVADGLARHFLEGFGFGQLESQCHCRHDVHVWPALFPREDALVNFLAQFPVMRDEYGASWATERFVRGETDHIGYSYRRGQFSGRD